MSPKTLLVEIRTEELPPAQLWRLADEFPDSLLAVLKKEGFVDGEPQRAKNERHKDKKLVTPRRLVALLHNIKNESAAKAITRRGPQLAACKDSEGAPTKALIGFMKSVGASCESDLTQTEEGGKIYKAWQGEIPGCKLADELAALVERVLLDLPAPRKMRWGDNDFKFIRPVRGVLMLHGDKVIGGKVFNIIAGETTKGHPVLGAEIPAFAADEYETVMRKHGNVIVDINARLEEISKVLVQAEIGKGSAFLMDEPDEMESSNDGVLEGRNRVLVEGPLLREVAAMCEHPVACWGEIEEEFMCLPIHCVTECMKKHQRFFPFRDKDGKLHRKYYFVVDNLLDDVIDRQAVDMLLSYGAVLRARLRDVQFYYNEDRKVSLDEYVEKLKAIVFHHKLGSQHARIGRVCRIAAALAKLNGKQYSVEDIEDTAREILAPLSTLMVGEYPQLQEYMARESCGNSPMFNFVCRCYDLEKLAGMFGVGEIPTGSKDPHGLRKNALEVAYSFNEWCDIKQSIAAVVDSFDGKIADVRDEVYEFIIERARFLFSRHSPFKFVSAAPPNVVESVLSLKPSDLRKVDVMIKAVRDFAKMAESQTLAAANKRINNIFRKSEVDTDALTAVDDSLFAEDAERTLYKTVLALRTQTDSLVATGDYQSALQTLATAAVPVDAFFDKVLVNAKDDKIRANRFALLRELRALLNRVADISKLAA